MLWPSTLYVKIMCLLFMNNFLPLSRVLSTLWTLLLFCILRLFLFLNFFSLLTPLTMSDDSTNLMCVPGQRLCLSDENTVAGVGTYERQGYIFSMLAGVVNIRPKDNVKRYKYSILKTISFSS